MQIYLVGGAVRDKLLGLAVKEKDWVVVGATVDQMLKLGYRQVGKDFPVFIHPKTGEEYALARTERKTGRGYTGFSFDTSPHVTLEEDLKRRDLTINAMAETADGQLIDPYHGKKDLDARILRHVSEAFAEDPVRILRVGRFAARFADKGFNIAPETLALMQQMVTSGEVDALVAERVWKELERALQESHPEEFFKMLQACRALPVLFPALCNKEKALTALMQATKLTNDSVVRFAALTHVLSEQELKDLSTRYKIPSDYYELALLIIKYGRDYAQIKSAQDMLDLLRATDAFRREERFEKFILASNIIAMPAQAGIQKTLKELVAAQQIAKQVPVQPLLDRGLKGKDIADALYQERLAAIKNKCRVD